MSIYLRSKETGRLYGRAKQWVSDKGKARVFKNFMAALRYAAKLREPVEVFFSFANPSWNFAVPYVAAA